MAVYSVGKGTQSTSRGYLAAPAGAQWQVLMARLAGFAITTAAMGGDRTIIGRATDGTTPTAYTPEQFSTRSPAAPSTTTLFHTWTTAPTIPGAANTVVVVSVHAAREDAYGFPWWQPGRSVVQPLAQDSERLDMRLPGSAAGETVDGFYIAGPAGIPPPPGRFAGRRPRTRGDWVYTRSWQQMTAGADTLARGLRQITWGAALQLPRNARYVPNEFLPLLGEPPVGGDATVTPATIACTAALPQAGVGVGAAPSVLAASAALPQPAVGVGAAPSQVAAVAALPQPAVSVGVAPAVLPALVALPQPAVGVGAAPVVIAAVVALPLPTSVGQTGDAIVTPAVVTALVALPAVVVSVGAAPAVIPAVATLPQAAVGVGAAPAVVALLAALPAAAVGVGAAPAAAVALVALPAATAAAGVAPAVIALLVALPLPDQVGGVIVNVNPEGPVQVGAITSETDAVAGATTQPAVLQGTIS